MAGENENLINFIATTVEHLRQRVESISEQMATKVDLANLRDEMETMREQMATKEELAAVKEQMATKEDIAALRREMATKNDLNRVETTMQGEFEQVHLRLNTLDRALSSRTGQIETDVSRLRSVVYLLVKDQPDLLRMLGQPPPRWTRPQR
jgi:hypothetical protein